MSLIILLYCLFLCVNFSHYRIKNFLRFDFWNINHIHSNKHLPQLSTMALYKLKYMPPSYEHQMWGMILSTTILSYLSNYGIRCYELFDICFNQALECREWDEKEIWISCCSSRKQVCLLLKVYFCFGLPCSIILFYD